MKSIARGLAGAAIFTASAAFAQVPEYAERSYEERPQAEAAYQSRAPLQQRELDQILAPVALYPDALLSQLLMASTYPREVAEAASWSRNNPGLQGDDAVRAVEREAWDPSVKSLVAFPDVLLMMADRIDWTARLGEAFLAQEQAVMGTVQALRQRADQAGNLRSGEQQMVERNGDNYVIEPSSPEMVHVPYYDPRVVYGDWWWPGYAPVYWNPWPGYAYYGGIGFGWGHGVRLHRHFFYGGFDWGRRHVRYSAHRPYYHSGNNYWRGWRDHRSDGRRYSNDQRSDGRRYANDRSQGNQPRYQNRDRTQPGNEQRDRTWRGDGMQRAEGGTLRRYDAARTVTPRYAAEGIQSGEGLKRFDRSAQVQRSANVPRAARVQPAMPNAGVQEHRLARPAAARSAQPAQRSAPAVQRSAQPLQRSERSSPRSSGFERRGGDDGNRGSGNGGSRGRER
jgi:hypothetical protein